MRPCPFLQILFISLLGNIRVRPWRLLATLLISLAPATLPALPPRLASDDRHVAVRLTLPEPTSATAEGGAAAIGLLETKGDDKTAAIRFQMDARERRKAYAIRLGGKSTPMEPPSVNGHSLGQRPTRGDDGWYYLVAPGHLREGENTLRVRLPDALKEQPLRKIEMVSLEDTFEEAHFSRVFAARGARREQPGHHPDQMKFDALDYDLSLTLNVFEANIPGASLTMVARCTATPLLVVPLDFDNNGGALVVSSVDGGAGTAPLGFQQDAAAKRLMVTLGEAPEVGSTFTIRVLYSGNPSRSGTFGASYRSGRHGASSAPIIDTLSEPYGARTWWPCKDIPSDKATATVRLTCPEAYTAVSNGTLLSNLNNGNGTRTFLWQESYPISTYLVSVACTNYVEVEDVYTALDGLTTMDVSHYLYPEDAAYEGSAAVAGTVSILEYFSETFGEYPFLREKYANATFTWGGAMEHQTCTSMHSRSPGADGLRSINVHEIAHQWFGDLVTMDHFDHLWLNEGFAKYCEALFDEGRYGKSAYHATVNSWSVSDAYPLVGPRADEFSSAIVYRKGAWVLHMLRGVVGDAVFFQAIRNYLADPDIAYGTALSDDLRAHFEALHGADLSWFFTEWLYRADRPDFRWAWRAKATAEGFMLYFWVDQEQTGGPYTMPVNLGITTSGGPPMQETIFIDRAPRVFKALIGPFEPTDVTWDPQNWALDQVSAAPFPLRALYVDTSTLDFDPIETGTTSTQTIQLENAGDLPFNVTSLEITGDDSAAYSVVAPQGAFNLSPGDTNAAEVMIRFAPSQTGQYNNATLIITTDFGVTERVDLRGGALGERRPFSGGLMLY